MDPFDVRYRFALDPLECVADQDAGRILRAQEFPYRPWQQAVPSQDKTAFWDDLSEYLREKVSVSEMLAQRFADFLVGYLLVIENESPGRALRPLRPLIGSAATAKPQRREHLQLILTRAMTADLSPEFSRKVACEVLIPQIWNAIGITVHPNSVLRIERRSRRRLE